MQAKANRVPRAAIDRSPKGRGRGREPRPFPLQPPSEKPLCITAAHTAHLDNPCRAGLAPFVQVERCAKTQAERQGLFCKVSQRPQESRTGPLRAWHRVGHPEQPRGRHSAAQRRAEAMQSRSTANRDHRAIGSNGGGRAE